MLEISPMRSRATSWLSMFSTYHSTPLMHRSISVSAWAYGLPISQMRSSAISSRSLRRPAKQSVTRCLRWSRLTLDHSSASDFAKRTARNAVSRSIIGIRPRLRPSTEEVLWRPNSGSCHSPSIKFKARWSEVKASGAAAFNRRIKLSQSATAATTGMRSPHEPVFSRRKKVKGADSVSRPFCFTANRNVSLLVSCRRDRSCLVCFVLIKLSRFGRAGQRRGGRRAAGDRLLHAIEVSGAHKALMLHRFVARFFFAGELLILQGAVSGHAVDLVIASQFVHRVIQGVESRQSDELEFVAHRAQFLLEFRDGRIIQILPPIE